MEASLLLVHTLLLFLLVSRHTSGQHSEDNCNWMLWDGADDSRSIRNVQTSCAEGSLKWKNPYGAIRLLFKQHQVPFEICFVAESSHAHIKISSESKHGLKHVLLLTPEAPETDDEICITSHLGGDVILFVESIWTGLSAVGVLNIDYDVRRLLTSPPPSSLDKTSYRDEDCRPCTNEELLRTVCSADFVVKGTMRHIENIHHRQETELFLSVTRLYKQLHAVFKPYSDLHVTSQRHSDSQGHKMTSQRHSDSQGHKMTSQRHSDSQGHKLSRNLEQSDSKNIKSITKQLESPTHSGKVIVPQKCNVNSGEEEFVFIGRIRLKRAHLSCAVRSDDFDRIWMDAVRKRRNRCNL